MFWSIDLRIDLSSNATRPSLRCMLIVLWWDIKIIKSIEYLWGFRAFLWWLIDIEPRYKINWISILWKRFEKDLIMGILRPQKKFSPIPLRKNHLSMPRWSGCEYVSRCFSLRGEFRCEDDVLPSGYLINIAMENHHAIKFGMGHLFRLGPSGLTMVC